MNLYEENTVYYTVLLMSESSLKAEKTTARGQVHECGLQPGFMLISIHCIWGRHPFLQSTEFIMSPPQTQTKDTIPKLLFTLLKSMTLLSLAGFAILFSMGRLLQNDAEST